jgi:ATP/maltotriose-dependent transcriptional regulator MalT
MARSRLIEAIEYQRRFGTEVKLAELECDHAGLAYRCGDVDGAIGAAIRVIENPAATSNQTFKARVSLALYFAYRGDINEARNHLDHADRMRDGRSSIEELRLEWARATVAMEGTDSERWREPALRSLKLAEEHASPALLAFTSMNFAGMASECGRRDLASTALRRAIAVADENGLTLASAYARCAAIAELHARGSLREAESMIRDVIALQVDATVARIFFASVSIPVLVDLGIAEHFKMLRDPSVLEIAFETGEQSRYVPAAAAFAYAEAMAGRTEGAHKFIDRALRGVTSARYIGGSLLTCARFGTSDHIATVWRLFEPEAGGRRNRPHLLLAEAIVARKSGDNARFREAVSNAITIAEREGLQPLVAYGLELQGRLNDARALYENCGAVAHVRRLSTKRSTSFTKREREIATLLRQGLSNRSISAKLVLSERTVENHIAAIYAKSGVRTRAEFLTASI